MLPLGDIQYGSSSLSNINAAYNPTWGRVKSISRPVIGNHEGSGTGYFDYFNGTGAQDGLAGPRGKGYYSFDLGSWHLVALNSNCDQVACSAGSEQEQWLRADLAAHPSACTLAYWHHPRYSSGHEENNTFMQPLWEALDDFQAELLLSGHSHDYERFAPQDRNGNLDPANGIRQFVVGTGGAFFTGGLGSLMPNSEVAQNDTFGVLFLTLHPTSYDWSFVPEAGKTFTDSGSTACHGPGSAPPPPPPPPPDETAPVISGVTVSPGRFSVAPRRPVVSGLSLSPQRFSVAASGARKRGTTFRYELSEAATVVVTISRRSRGRKVGKRCGPATRANRGRGSCIRYRRVGSFKQEGLAGGNSRWFGGRIGRTEARSGPLPSRLQGHRRGRQPVAIEDGRVHHRYGSTCPEAALTSHMRGATFKSA